MGTSTNAMLIYGYHLGGPESGWEIEEVDKYDQIDTTRIDWLAIDGDEDDDSEGDFVELAPTRLLSTAGFTETDWRAEGFYERKRAAEGRLGITIESHCSSEYSMYVLAACATTARRGYTEVVDFDELRTRALVEEWDRKLAEAIKALGITPKQAGPKWLLCSYWG